MSATTLVAPEHRHSTIRVLTIGSAGFAVLTALTYALKISWVAPIPHDATTLVVGRDFLNFWMYGRAAWMPDPERFYDPQIYNDTLTAFLGPDYPGQNWSYPPSIMLAAATFGKLPYLWALAIWTALGLAIFIAVARRQLADRALLVPVLCSPAAMFCLMSGQSSFITTAMLLTIMAVLDRRPVFAGILIGLLSLKPQLGLLFPVMLIASGRWRVFVAATVTTLVIVAATAAIFGPQSWIDFVTEGIPVQNLVLVDPQRVGTPFYPTIFMNVRGAGLSYAVAMTVQACFSAFAVAAVAFAFRYRRDADPLTLNGLFFACAICAVPYLLSYDVLTLTCVATMMLASGRLDARGEIVAKLVFWLPLLQIGLGQFHIPGPALIPPVFAVVLLLRLVKSADTRQRDESDAAARVALGAAS